MSDITIYGSALIAAIIVVIILIGKMDTKATLFAMGIVLMYIAIAMGSPITIREFESASLTVLDLLKTVINRFKNTLPAIGFIILILGGYSVYMTSIGASEVTVYTLTKPIKKIKSMYILIPLVFLTGSVLSPVIPSTSGLAIILLAILYPVLCQTGMFPLIAATVIVTTAAVMPTPLGDDSVAVITEPAKYPASADMSVTDYVIQYHAMIPAPTPTVTATIHFSWQKLMDKKNTDKLGDSVEVREVKAIPEGGLYRFVYTLLPVSPTLLPIVAYIIRSVAGSNVDISVEVASLLSFLVAIVCEIIRTEDSGKVLKQIKGLFKGMGSSMPTVVLLVAASIFVLDLNSIGSIDALQTVMLGVQESGMGFVLPLILMGLTVLIVLLNGNGIALFYAMAPSMVPLAEAVGIPTVAVSIPTGLCDNLMRAVFLVAAVVITVVGTIKANPLDIVKRTSVPMIADVVTMLVLSMIMFP